MTRLSDIDAVIARLRAFARPQEMSAACEIADLSALLDDHARLVERLTELRAEEAAWHYGLAADRGAARPCPCQGLSRWSGKGEVMSRSDNLRADAEGMWLDAIRNPMVASVAVAIDALVALVREEALAAAAASVTVAQRCPHCSGTGLDPYATNTTAPPKCRICGGLGVPYCCCQGEHAASCPVEAVAKLLPSEAKP